MSDKKGFEIQFNWIFILIAGAAIILFFTAIVIKQKSSSESSIKNTILKSIESIVSSAGVSTDTITVEDIPNSNIEVECDKVSVGGIAKQYQNLIMFSPNSIKGDSLITQTLTFAVPYRATNLLYITSPSLRYTLVGDNNLAKEINKSLPLELKKEFFKSVPVLRNSNNYKIKLAVFDDTDMASIDLDAFKKTQDSSVTAVKIVGDEKKGDLEFYQKNGNRFELKGTSSYISKSAIIGSIYSDSVGLYNCNMQNVFSRLNIVTKVYLERTENLKELTKANPQCVGIYEKALTILNTMLAESSDFNHADTKKMKDAAESLAAANNEAQVYSCPLIY